MSSRGELYITEDCRDAFAPKLDKAFGKDEWYLDPSNYMNFWCESEIPTSIEVNVLNSETEEIIGRVEIIGKQSIETEYGESYIVISPKKIKIIKNVKG